MTAEQNTPGGKPDAQAMKPQTAAKKLGIYLPAAPAEFRDAPVSRETFAALQSDPPEWLAELRRTGPHPREVVARKLGVSTSGLSRAGATDALTTEDIKALLADPPQWLITERATQAAVRDENARVKARNAERAARRQG